MKLVGWAFAKIIDKIEPAFPGMVKFHYDQVRVTQTKLLDAVTLNAAEEKFLMTAEVDLVLLSKKKKRKHFSKTSKT